MVVDIQNDFLPGGALQVGEGDRIVPLVNKLMKKFDFVLATKYWHPANHKSFASNHHGKNPGDRIMLHGLDQVLWPDHCVQGTIGAEFSPQLDHTKIDRVFYKGDDPEIDSYSGFYDNGQLRSTGLGDYLHRERISSIYIVGLATDFCVKATALDAVNEGFEAHVVADATRAVNLNPGDYEKAIKEMEHAGVLIIGSRHIL